ncbi:RluA family pseudouridine synthase [Helicobacter burdigaliensis]
MQPIQSFSPKKEDIGLRLDQFLVTSLHLSRSQIHTLLKEELVLLNNQKVKKNGTLLKEKDIITLLKVKEKEKEQKELDIPILYEDEDLLILNKPIDLITHKANEKDLQFTLIDYLKEHSIPLSNLGDSSREGIVHRLDKTTSGAMIIAKNNQTHALLSTQIKERQIQRYYLCVIDSPLKNNIIVQSPLMRHPKNRLKYITTNPQDTRGKEAKSAFFKIQSNTNLELIGAKLFSGRTHQIRAHLASLNRHILGDYFYGYKGEYSKRILLHSHFLSFIHPKSKKLIEIYAPLYKDMLSYIRENFYKDNYEITAEFKIPLHKLFSTSF